MTLYLNDIHHVHVQYLGFDYIYMLAVMIFCGYDFSFDMARNTVCGWMFLLLHQVFHKWKHRWRSTEMKLVSITWVW